MSNPRWNRTKYRLLFKTFLSEKIKEFEEPVAEEIEDTTKIKDVFKEISSIDEKISRLLIENDIDTIGKLNEKTIKELTKIKGINNWK